MTLGGQPVDGGMIKFVPAGAAKGGGQIDVKDGRYASEPSWQLAPGKYRVEIEWHDRTWKAAPTRSDSGAMIAETKQLVPSRYNSKSELTVDLRSGRNTDINFDLASDGPVAPEMKKKPAGD